jgi:hypothetical protein
MNNGTSLVIAPIEAIDVEVSEVFEGRFNGVQWDSTGNNNGYWQKTGND